MSHPPTGRRRGGQPGNQNRLKHGLYSKHLAMDDTAKLESISLHLNRHELALARVRLKTCIEKQLSASPEDWLTYERAIARYLHDIVSSIHQNAKNNRRFAPLDFMEMIRQGNED
jgi:hypothetical protein